MNNEVIVTEITKENIDDNYAQITFEFQNNFKIVGEDGMILNIEDGILKYDRYYFTSQNTSILRPNYRLFKKGKNNIKSNFISVLLEIDKPYILQTDLSNQQKVYCMYVRKGIDNGVLCFEDIDNYIYETRNKYFTKEELINFIEENNLNIDISKIKVNNISSPSFYEYDLSTYMDRFIFALSNLVYKSKSVDDKKSNVQNLVVFDELNNLSKITICKDNIAYKVSSHSYKYEIPIIETIDSLPGKKKKNIDEISTYYFDDKAHINKSLIKRFK